MIIRVAVRALDKSPMLRRLLWRWWYARLAKRFTQASWTFMNYGYEAGGDAEPMALDPDDEPDRLCAQLYEQVVTGVDLSNREVIEIGCPAEHMTAVDHDLALPTPELRPARDFGGQRFVRHIAGDASYAPWHRRGFECRDTGIGDATGGLGGVRVVRPGRALLDGLSRQQPAPVDQGRGAGAI